MGTAQYQGSLWGTRARDYAEILEQFGRPLYEAVFDAAGVEAGTKLLDRHGALQARRTKRGSWGGLEAPPPVTVRGDQSPR